MTDQTPAFPRGATITVVVEVLEGDPTGYTVTAKLKPRPNAAMPAASVPVAATFTVQFVAASGPDLAHWLLTIPAATSATLAAGRYVMDAQFVLSGQPVQVTDPLIIMIRESVTP